MTDKELHDSYLADIFDHLKSAQAALDSGDTDLLRASIELAGFSICCVLPESYLESAPGAWFESTEA